MTVAWWAWVAVVACLAVLLTVDLLSAPGGQHSDLLRPLLAASAWIGSAVIFGIVLAFWQGSHAAAQYFSGYLLEKSLSIDNIFVFAVIFRSLSVPHELQHRVLYYGVIGALSLRGAFIASGGALIDHIDWMIYPFGGLILLAGARMIRGENVHPRRNLAVRLAGAIIPITPQYFGPRFFTTVHGRRVGTGLLAALITIEATDLVFAMDSIPAIFGITRNLFIVFTSNAFAVLGLRSLYFLVIEAMSRFAYLSRGIALLLLFIGFKMLLSRLITIPTTGTLAVIIAIIVFSVLASICQHHFQH